MSKLSKFDFFDIGLLIVIVLLCFAAALFGAEPDVAVPKVDGKSYSVRNASTPFRLDVANIKKLENITRRVTLESREIIGGKMVEHWRDGSRTWATTNAPVTIEGRKLRSTFAEKTEKLAKAEKAARKAAKKDAKNLEKFIKETVKARGKSSDEMRELYDGILDIVTNFTATANN